MMVQCVTHVISSQYLEFVGNVLNVGIMTFVQFATMGINIISVIVFIVLLHLVVKGKVMIAWVITLHGVTDILEACPVSIFRVTGNILMDTEVINLLTPNANYSGRTAPLTSKISFYIFIQQI